MAPDTENRSTERVARVEGKVDQMDKRVGRVEDEITRLHRGVESPHDGIVGATGGSGYVRGGLRREIREMRRDIRFWLVLLVLATASLVTIVQLAIASVT